MKWGFLRIEFRMLISMSMLKQKLEYFSLSDGFDDKYICLSLCTEKIVSHFIFCDSHLFDNKSTLYKRKQKRRIIISFSSRKMIRGILFAVLIAVVFGSRKKYKT